MTSNFFKIFISVMVIFIAFAGCKKDNKDIIPDEEGAIINMGISDARDNQISKSDSKTTDGSKLTKCEVAISNIQLKNTDGEYIDILSEPTIVDLRQFKGTVRSLLSINIPLGSYTSIQVAVSGVSTTYEGNTYTASVTGGANVTLEDIPGMIFTESQGVVNAFYGGNITFELPLQFTIDNITDVESIRLFFDAEASTYVITYSYLTYSYNFAGIRALPNVSIILEQGIQQIKHSPPMGITIVGVNDIDYYGIHTFVDFTEIGGTINSHTSQHVFRGEDGSLLVDAEDMYTNINPLSSNEISATGETDITADETFKFTQFETTLLEKGYTLELGKTYYFSLRKTWNITTDGKTYNLTRICEPIPVFIPDL